MMIITTKSELQSKINHLKSENRSIGFVPTMGYLHEGHVKLLEEARSENDFVVLSIFVNPLQFGPNEDYDSYPRNTKRDVELAEMAGVDIIFMPEVTEMYPENPSFTVKVHSRVDVLCGKSRVGHFDGVATIVTKLFNLVRPNKAYFGMKDAQQVAVIDGLIKELNFPIKLVAVSTIREEDGLAKSSRNINLSKKEREQAPALYESLVIAKESIQNGERNLEKIKNKIEATIREKTDGTIDYVEILSYPELIELDQLSGEIILALAVKFTKARLIDNITMAVD